MVDDGLRERNENRPFRQTESQLALQKPDYKLGLAGPSLVLSDVDLASAIGVGSGQQLLDPVDLPSLCTVAGDGGDAHEALEDALDGQRLRLEHGLLCRPALDSHQSKIANLLLVLLDDSKRASSRVANSLHDQRLADSELDTRVVGGKLVDHEQHRRQEVVGGEPHDLTQKQRAVRHDFQTFRRHLDEREGLAQCRVGHGLARLPIWVWIFRCLGCQDGLDLALGLFHRLLLGGSRLALDLWRFILVGLNIRSGIRVFESRGCRLGVGLVRCRDIICLLLHIGFWCWGFLGRLLLRGGLWCRRSLDHLGLHLFIVLFNAISGPASPLDGWCILLVGVFFHFDWLLGLAIGRGSRSFPRIWKCEEWSAHRFIVDAVFARCIPASGSLFSLELPGDVFLSLGAVFVAKLSFVCWGSGLEPALPIHLLQ